MTQEHIINLQFTVAGAELVIAQLRKYEEVLASTRLVPA